MFCFVKTEKGLISDSVKVTNASLFFTDIDECANPSKNNCSSNANCTDTIGSYDCTCEIGYSGNGYTCDGKLV